MAQQTKQLDKLFHEGVRYGTLHTWAQELGHKDAVTILSKTLDEESKTDALLTKLAEKTVNREAQAA